MPQCAAIADSTRRRCQSAAMKGSQYCRHHKYNNALRATAIARPSVAEAKPSEVEKDPRLPPNMDVGDEHTIDLSKQKGSHVVMLGSPMCGYCRQTYPEFIEAAKKVRDRNFVIIDVRTSPTLSQKFEVRGVPHIIGIDDKKRVHLFNHTGLPRNAAGLATFAKSL